MFVAGLVVALGVIVYYAARGTPGRARRYRTAGIAAATLTTVATLAALAFAYGAALAGGLFGGNPEQDAAAHRANVTAARSGGVAVVALLVTIALFVMAAHAPRDEQPDRVSRRPGP